MVRTNVGLMVERKKKLSEIQSEQEQYFKESEPEKPKSWGQQAKSLGSSILSSVGNMAINAIGGLAFELLLKGGFKLYDHFANRNANIIWISELI